ncbi:MAG: DUF4340 domain-containing protein [Proteobacteria bacterium]|jgi:hypothetical protein|nr:DUF4340 domain-containing protein [Pseudomonadota bacterium]
MRKIIIAVVVLAALGAAAFLALREEPDAARQSAKSALVPLPAERLSRIEIKRHEPSQDPMDDEFITLEREGDVWSMTKPVAYPVNATSVAKMVEALGALKTIDVISDNKAKHAVLEVDDALGIEVKAFDGEKQLAGFIVGVSRGDMTMVRLPGKDEVYRVKGAIRTTFNKSVKNLRDHTVTKLDRGSVVRVRITGPEGVFEMAKKGDGKDAKFEPVGDPIQNFDTRKADGLANALTGLSARDFVDAPVTDDVSGLGEGAMRVVFEAAKDGVKGTFTVLIGKTLEKERETYVKTSLSDQVFLVASHIVSRFKTKAADFARTDEQVADEEKRRKEAEDHTRMHEDHAQAGAAREAAGQSIPPEILEQLKAKMANQPQGGQPAPPPPHDAH